MSGFFVNAALISLLTLIAILAIRLHRLFAVVMLSGAFSLVAARRRPVFTISAATGAM